MGDVRVNRPRWQAVGLWLVLFAAMVTALSPALGGQAYAAGVEHQAETLANETRILYEGDRLSLASAPGRAVWGRTDLGAGAVVTVRVNATDADQQYLRSTAATVGADGLFRATFDLSDLPPGTALRVVVHREGETLAATTGEVVDCESCPVEPPRTPSAVVRQAGANLTVEDAPGQVVAGRSNLQPGAKVTVQLRSSAGASPFIKQTAATVDGNGTFRAVFDFEEVAEATRFTVAVRYDGTALTSTTGWVACDGGCGPPDTTADATSADRSGLADAAVGVVQVPNGSVAEVRVRLGDATVADLSVGAPGTSYALEATLRDGNGDGVVVLLFDTGAAGRPKPTLVAAADRDAVAVHDERGRFAATDYRLVISPPDGNATAATGLLVVTQNGTGGTPLVTTAPGAGGVPLGSAAALLAGVVLAAIGLASLLGLVDVGTVLDRV